MKQRISDAISNLVEMNSIPALESVEDGEDDRVLIRVRGIDWAAIEASKEAVLKVIVYVFENALGYRLAFIAPGIMDLEDVPAGKVFLDAMLVHAGTSARFLVANDVLHLQHDCFVARGIDDDSLRAVLHHEISLMATTMGRFQLRTWWRAAVEAIGDDAAEDGLVARAHFQMEFCGGDPFNPADGEI